MYQCLIVLNGTSENQKSYVWAKNDVP